MQGNGEEQGVRKQGSEQRPFSFGQLLAGIVTDSLRRKWISQQVSEAPAALASRAGAPGTCHERSGEAGLDPEGN